MANVTYADLTALPLPIQDADLIAAYRAAGPLQRLPASAIKTYLQGIYLPLAGGQLAGALNLATGMASTPSLAFTGDSDTGLYSAGTNALGVAVGGVSVGQFDATGWVPVNAAQARANLGLADAALTTGATFTGQVTINYLAGSTLELAQNGNATNNIQWRASGNIRWQIGRNTLHNLQIVRYNSSGVLQGSDSKNTSTGDWTYEANVGTMPASDPSVGTTAGWRATSSGTLQAAASANPALHLNRLTSDGQITTFYRQGSPIGSISITASAVAYNTTSDYRLKDNITDADPEASLDLIRAVPLHNFDWKATGAHDLGVIAHELQALKPTAVTGAKDGEEMQGVDYSKLVPDLIGAVQALIKRVEAR